MRDKKMILVGAILSSSLGLALISGCSQQSGTEQRGGTTVGPVERSKMPGDKDDRMGNQDSGSSGGSSSSGSGSSGGSGSGSGSGGSGSGSGGGSGGGGSGGGGGGGSGN